MLDYTNFFYVEYDETFWDYLVFMLKADWLDYIVFLAVTFVNWDFLKGLLTSFSSVLMCLQKHCNMELQWHLF